MVTETGEPYPFPQRRLKEVGRMMSFAIVGMLVAWVAVVLWVWSATSQRTTEDVEVER